MATERNLIQEVLSLIQQLEQERQQHQQRIDEIDSALSQVRGGKPVAASAAAKAVVRSAPAKAAVSPPAGSGGNTMTLRERMTMATSKQPLSVREVVEAVIKAGHKFKSADPIKSVGSYLYGPEGKKHFKRANGKFSPLGGSAPVSTNGVTGKPAKAKKRTMSAEARRKISAAVTARWAKQKAGKK